MPSPFRGNKKRFAGTSQALSEVYDRSPKDGHFEEFPEGNSFPNGVGAGSVQLKRPFEALGEMVQDGRVTDQEGDPRLAGRALPGGERFLAEGHNREVGCRGILAQMADRLQNPLRGVPEICHNDHRTGCLGSGGQLRDIRQRLDTVAQILQTVHQLGARQELLIRDNRERFNHPPRAWGTCPGIAKNFQHAGGPNSRKSSAQFPFRFPSPARIRAQEAEPEPDRSVGNFGRLETGPEWAKLPGMPIERHPPDGGGTWDREAWCVVPEWV